MAGELLEPGLFPDAPKPLSRLELEPRLLLDPSDRELLDPLRDELWSRDDPLRDELLSLDEEPLSPSLREPLDEPLMPLSLSL